MQTQLKIKEYYPEEENQPVQWEFTNLYYDLKTHILIETLYTNIKLKSGIIYEFTFDDGFEKNTYHYTVLKQLNSQNYLVAQYYDCFYREFNPNYLGNGWIHINDFEKQFNINFQKVEEEIINNYKESTTYRELAIKKIRELLKTNYYTAKEIVNLIENEGEYKPCALGILNAPEYLEDWSTKILKIGEE